MMKTRRKGKMPKIFIMGVFLILLIGLSLVRINRVEASLASYVVINEVQTNSGSDYDDWVELFNPTAQDINLSTWSIQKTNSSGSSTISSFYRKALTGVIPAGSYFLIVRDNALTSQSLKDLANVKAAGTLFSLTDDNIIFLVNNNIDIVDHTDENIVDYVGLGQADYFEGVAAAPNPAPGQSVVRVPDGEDSNNNNLDFKLANNPTPKTGSSSSDNQIGGTVGLTITPDAEPVKNITSIGAEIVFQVNAAGTALIKYGLDNTYASSTLPEEVAANISKTITINNLACATLYHYVIYAENTAATENDQTSDAIFTTLPCGIKVDSLVMTKLTAKANNQYTDGWQWEFNITVWDMIETSLKMKFDPWSGATVLAAGANMQFSVDNGAVWHDITANSAYPALGADIDEIDNGAGAGRQVKIIVRMKVPTGTIAGYYNSNYGILTE